MGRNHPLTLHSPPKTGERVLLEPVRKKLVAILWAAALAGVATGEEFEFRAVMVHPDRPADQLQAELSERDYNAVVLRLDGNPVIEKVREVAERTAKSRRKLGYWLEIGRCPELADMYPEWMSSVQGHTEWRRLYPDLRHPTNGEVVKNYPWVPIMYAESQAAHVQRVRRLLSQLPPAALVFLNDLQGGPSACGCGHPLCRWTADYGPIQTATPLGAEAASQFVAAVQGLASTATVVPVWTTECEEHDRDGLCGGVECYAGTCWRAMFRQLGPLVRQCDRIAVLAPYKLFDRDVPHYGGEGEWVKQALRSFQEMPPLRGGEVVPADRLLAVLQGWDVSPAQVNAQIRHVRDAGAAGFVLSLEKIAQDWQPRIVRYRAQRP